MQDSTIRKAADNIRILSAAMVQKAKSGHPGGAMGAADFMAVLFGEFLRWDPENPQWIARDRFYMDPGHMSPLIYSLAHLTHRLEMEDLKHFRQLNSHTPGHPELQLAHGIENTSGPLGLGHAIALGSAIGERFLAERFGEIVAHKTYVLISDGGIQEEISYGVGRIAGHLKLSNLILFYDSNKVQLSCHCADVMTQDVRGQYEAWGWRVLEIDPYVPEQSRAALQQAQAETEKPVLIIGHTTIGKGVRKTDGTLWEGKVEVHGQPLDGAGASTAETIRGLGGDPQNPFVVFPEVQSAFDQRLQELRSEVATWKSAKTQWDAANSEKTKALTSWFSGKPPQVDVTRIPQKEGVATRVNSGSILAYLAENVGNMICSSADLSNSDNTQAFLDRTGIFKPGDFRGAFVQPGVAELTMASIANGIALHGGLIPVCATFFVFSDFMKPAMRLAALMGLPVKYVFTHDSFRVGEDGPTHQPVEHESQLRLLEKLTRKDGQSEMLVLRPADWAETAVAWQMALENHSTPTALILTRQAAPALPAQNATARLESAAQARRGGYVVSDNSQGRPDLSLIANGSDVMLCHQAAELLRAQGKKVRVVSMISPRLFLLQDQAWRDSVLPPFRPVLGLSSGLPCVFDRVVGPMGRSIGLERFGASAPFTVLEELFGFTPQSVAQKAESYLADFHATCLAIQQNQ
ncbi:MAG TPA: transketolase [Fibrobacteraceae bacterium]|nr:transketolase [Fibrobacteraceae bacterium]